MTVECVQTESITKQPLSKGPSQEGSQDSPRTSLQSHTGRHPGRFTHPRSAIDAPCSGNHVNNDRLLCALLYWGFTSYQSPGAMRQGVSRIHTVRIETQIGTNVQNYKTVALRS